MALSFVSSMNSTRVALDFGCGAGNLTSKLSDLGCEVIACDVSQGFLDLVESRKYKNRVETVRLNGIDLSNVEDGSVDMVATYSVLHHVPDYLGIVKEFVRVLKPGGVIFIDHEASGEVWDAGPERVEFLKEMQRAIGCKFCKYLRPRNYVEWLIRKFINPRYQAEGDIHVYDDDHIEWLKIADALTMAGADVVYEEDYLLYRNKYDKAVYMLHSKRTSDTHLLIARKNNEA